MKTERAFVGARGVDSLPFSQGGTTAQAEALAASGIEFFVGYLGVINGARLKRLLDAGVAFMPVTLASAYNGATSVAQCKALGLPSGTTVWLDLEGKAAYDTPAPALIAKINAWADAVKAAGYEPGLYVGSPQPLTSEELYALRVVRYWNALSRESDRNGKLAEPRCGWCMWQMNDSVIWKGTGVFVDVNMIGKDFQGRLPTWVRSSECAMLLVARGHAANRGSAVRIAT